MTSQTTSAPASSLVIVDDGQYRWAADRAQLTAALDAAGWERYGEYATGVALYREPELDEDADSTQAYTELCGDVTSVAGEGATLPITEVMQEQAGRFTFRQDIGFGVWTLS